jgi:quinoprotein relay system zinc metallohydrolase 2
MAREKVCSRRAFVGSGLCACCLSVLPAGKPARAGAAAAQQSSAEQARSSAAAAERENTQRRANAPAMSIQQVAPGLFVRKGVIEDVTRANHDAIANVAFIVGRESVAVIDPGGSLEDGRRLRAAIRKITPLPIRFVVISHVHPDHIFGGIAFEADRPEVVSHFRLPSVLQQRTEYYRQRLEAVLEKNQAGAPLKPTHFVRDPETIDLGGRRLELTPHPTAHSSADLSVLDAQTNTLLPGDLLFVQRIPSLDGSLKGWLKELETLKGRRAQRAVPGHGPASVDWPQGAADLERYLSILLRETRAAIAKGLDIDAAVKTVGQSERTKWQLFDDYHGGNVTQAFKELEWE